jgi:hypothetical protein
MPVPRRPGGGYAAIFTLVVASHCVVATIYSGPDDDPDLDETMKQKGRRMRPRLF